MRVAAPALASAGDDERSRTLEVELPGGEVVRYFGVPRTVFERLVGGTDPTGSYFARAVRDVYPYGRQR